MFTTQTTTNDLLEELRILREENQTLKKTLAIQKEENQRLYAHFQGQRERERFFDLSLVLFCIADNNGYFLEVNPAWEKLLGYTKQELISTPYLEFVHPDDLEITKSESQKVQAGAKSIQFENRYRTKDGSYRHLLWNSIPLPEEGIIYCVAHDITKQKEVEAELRASREKLRAITDSLPGIIIYADKEFRFRYVNANCEKWMGKTKEEMVNKYTWEVLGEKAYYILKKAIRKVLTGKSAFYEGKLTLDNGNVYDVDVRLVPDFNSQGEIRGYYAFIHDMSERYKAQKQIRLQSAAMESAIDGISILKNNKFIYVNQSKLNILGYDDNSEIIGKDWFKLYCRNEIKRFKREIFPSLQEKKYWRGEIMTKRKDDSTVIEEMSLTKVNNTTIVAVCRDITERKQAEDKLRIAEENYRSIFENALEGIFQSTPEGKYIQVNAAMAEIHGYNSPEEMIEKIENIDQQIYVNAEVREEFQRLLNQQDKVENFEYQIRRRNGQIIWVEESTKAVRDRNKNLLYYEGIVQDITERKRKEEHLKRTINELRISIDKEKCQKEVELISNSEYFKELKSNLLNIRSQGEI